MSKHLTHELDRLEQNLLSLSALVEESVRKALKSFLDRDLDLAEQVIAGDDDIDRREVELEEECLKLLALYQPVAIDLRFIVAALKINNDLERVGDLASSIAKKTRKLVALPQLELPFDLREMADKALVLLRQSLDAFVHLDATLARSVRLRDREVDDLNRTLEATVAGWLVTDKGCEVACMQLLWVSRALERVGDHATNIAEDIIYLMEGEIVRHTGKKRTPETRPGKTTETPGVSD